MVSRIDALQRIDEGTIAETQALRVDEDGVTLVKYPSRSQSVFDDNKVLFIRAQTRNQMTAHWNDVPAPTGKEALSRTYPAGHRTDVIDVPIQGNNGQLEYMIRMKAGETVVYSWEVLNITNPQSFYTEFHGHTETAPGQPGDLMFYEKASGSKASGSLIAPWQGIHGWFWQNKSDAPVVVRLRMAGFYELIPGQAG